jgi:adenylyltransferase/sulfurtransferase
VRAAPDAKPVTELAADYAAFCALPGDEAGAAIGVGELAGWLAERERGEREFVLVDVREPEEREIARIPGAVNVPLGRLREGAAAELAALPGQRLVFHCMSGGRSAEARRLARAAGYPDAVHVAGGVLAWVDDIDPDQPRC